MLVIQDKLLNTQNNKATFDLIPLLTKSRVVPILSNSKRKKWIFNSQQWNASCELLKRLQLDIKLETKSFSVHHAQSTIKAMSVKSTSSEEDNVQWPSTLSSLRLFRGGGSASHEGTPFLGEGMLTSSSLNPPETTAERTSASLFLFLVTTSVTKIFKKL